MSLLKYVIKSKRSVIIVTTLALIILSVITVESRSRSKKTPFVPTAPVGFASPKPAQRSILASATNPINDPQFFVREQYLDFLNRDPDDSGLNFWSSNITQCGSDAACTEVKRINTSAAFFLSIEFQNTGYLVYRTYKVAYGNLSGKPVPITLQQFLPDTQAIGNGVIVNQDNWQQRLETNKQAYFNVFVMRDQFAALYPQTMTPEQFVDTLNTNAGGMLSQATRDSLVNDLKTGVKTRAQALRMVAEDQTLQIIEFNKAFVLMQYFGYLKRNPDDAPDQDFSGWQFWLNKLNQFNGNYINAEMVKAFIESDEYQKRFDTQVWNSYSNPQLGFTFAYPNLNGPTSVDVSSSTTGPTPSQVVKIYTDNLPAAPSFMITVADNPNRLHLQTWFQENVDVNNLLTNANTFQPRILSNGATALILTNDIPDEFNDEGGYVDYAYWMSPSRGQVYSITLGGDTNLAYLGYSESAAHDLILRVAETFSY